MDTDDQTSKIETSKEFIDDSDENIFSPEIWGNSNLVLANVLEWQLSIMTAEPGYYIERLLNIKNKVSEKYVLGKYYCDVLNQTFSDRASKVDQKCIKFMESISFVNSVLLNNGGEQMGINIRLSF